MPSTNLTDLVQYLRGPILRVRTGLWLAPPGLWGHEADQAAALGVDAADARQPLLNALLPGQTRLGLRDHTIIAAMDEITKGDFRSDCCLVYNLDLLLAGLTYSARVEVWESLYSGLPHRHRALLITMPKTAAHLLPSADQLNAWRREGRLVD